MHLGPDTHNILCGVDVLPARKRDALPCAGPPKPEGRRRGGQPGNRNRRRHGRYSGAARQARQSLRAEIRAIDFVIAQALALHACELRRRSEQLPSPAPTHGHKPSQPGHRRSVDPRQRRRTRPHFLWARARPPPEPRDVSGVRRHSRHLFGDMVDRCSGTSPTPCTRPRILWSARFAGADHRCGRDSFGGRHWPRVVHYFP